MWSTIFQVFSMTRPGIEPRSSRPLANTLPTWSMSWITLNSFHLSPIFKRNLNFLSIWAWTTKIVYLVLICCVEWCKNEPAQFQRAFSLRREPSPSLSKEIRAQVTAWCFPKERFWYSLTRSLLPAGPHFNMIYIYPSPPH